MNIIHIQNHEEQKETLEKVIAQYNTQRNARVIFPELVDYLSTEDFTGLIVASEPEKDKLIKGIILYDTFTIQRLDEFEEKLRMIEPNIIDENQQPFCSPLKSLEVFRNQSPENVFSYITAMETFAYRRGIGRALMETLQACPAISGIFLQSLEARRFYEKIGFQEIGLYCDSKDSPYMIWVKK